MFPVKQRKLCTKQRHGPYVPHSALFAHRNMLGIHAIAGLWVASNRAVLPAILLCRHIAFKAFLEVHCKTMQSIRLTKHRRSTCWCCHWELAKTRIFGINWCECCQRALCIEGIFETLIHWVIFYEFISIYEAVYNTCLEQSAVLYKKTGLISWN